MVCCTCPLSHPEIGRNKDEGPGVSISHVFLGARGSSPKVRIASPGHSLDTIYCTRRLQRNRELLGPHKEDIRLLSSEACVRQEAGPTKSRSRKRSEKQIFTGSFGFPVSLRSSELQRTERQDASRSGSQRKGHRYGDL